jgi:hypothetical protein
MESALASGLLRPTYTTSWDTTFAIPSTVSKHSWNLIFDPARAAGFYEARNLDGLHFGDATAALDFAHASIPL